MDWGVIYEYREMFIRGVGYTILFTSVGVFMGTILGLLFGLGRLSKNPILRWPSVAYITVFRGTPLFVQILLIHYAAIPEIWGLFSEEPPSVVFSGFVVLSLNAGAYIAEIFRAGIRSIDRGQMEAARSLGMNHGQAMRYVILPQAFKRMIPPLGNEFIALLKDSSLLAVIAAPELTYAGNATAKSTFARWESYLTMAAIYLVLTLLISRFVTYLEKRFATE
ncbi:amino acid ABC transporter permease [Aneurinibacillus thermoaerophilus]|nr:MULTISPECIES: amino acid ABC transporter permease [Aneurinibacillus]AMA74575.1 amino acid ABC transporter permease [Aneurinibacillus sp. XH2]MED0674231.1 amino acid ABC transporter permease [Aneurinibacillus thermoaerophilus]MED0678245.1 amino acid ABC transporter permease [Aneurinibacillus thermoaerophilus]MED0735623.1 amino acid ABC transporter permease [Aneurinibacillus thermoaerophilus]MED0757561.1 amino acid ABC transporter permease [Aneurinibacillus thermoaerophilus]